MKINRIYFAHPVSDYDTEREGEFVSLIHKAFPGSHVVNPNGEDHKEAYALQGMSYFEELVCECEALVAAPFPDGTWGMGVWKEIDTMIENGGKVYQIFAGGIHELDHKDISPLSINDTKRKVRAWMDVQSAEKN
jgi:hypothetical protein